MQQDLYSFSFKASLLSITRERIIFLKLCDQPCLSTAGWNCPAASPHICEYEQNTELSSNILVLLNQWDLEGFCSLSPSPFFFPSCPSLHYLKLTWDAGTPTLYVTFGSRWLLNCSSQAGLCVCPISNLIDKKSGKLHRFRVWPQSGLDCLSHTTTDGEGESGAIMSACQNLDLI